MLDQFLLRPDRHLHCGQHPGPAPPAGPGRPPHAANVCPPCQRRRTQSTTAQSKAQLIDKAVKLAQLGKGTGGPPHDQVGALLRAYYRHVAPEDLADRSDVDVYGVLAAHHQLAAERPQGTAPVRVFTPTLGEHGWSAGGTRWSRSSSTTCPSSSTPSRWSCRRQLRDVHLVIHPQLRRRARHHRRPASVAPGRAAPPTPDDGGSASRGCTSRSTGSARRRHRGARRRRAAGAARRPRGRRGLGQDARAGRRDRRRLPADPPPLASTRSARPPSSSRGWPTSTSPSWATASTTSSRSTTATAGTRCARPRHRARHPALRPGRPGQLLRPPARAGAGQGPRADAAGAGQGQLARHGAPPGLPRLRRREDLRRRRRGHRRAPLPRAVLLRRLHRVALADPAAAREGAGGARRARLRPAAATPARR